MSMMLNILAGVAIFAVLGVAAWLAAPLLFDKRVREGLPPAFEEMTGNSGDAPAVPGERRGVFAGADSFHQAGGTARLLTVEGKTYVRFEDDFSVTNGPDLFVYFGRDGSYDADTNIGRLKGNQGSQNYEVPADIDPSAYDEVWIWCRAFAVAFGSAELR